MIKRNVVSTGTDYGIGPIKRLDENLQVTFQIKIFDGNTKSTSEFTVGPTPLLLCETEKVKTAQCNLLFIKMKNSMLCKLQRISGIWNERFLQV